jgi:three-Cys-motif partner protein
VEILPDAHDDGFYYEDGVGAWVEDKHRLVAMYQAIFSRGMKHKWENRVYIDLFSGPGLVRVRGGGKFLWSSPLLALQAKDPFDHYIFCEREANVLSALRTRVEKYFPSAKVSYVEGDSNKNVDEIRRKIPNASRSNTVLSFCFVDPYDLSVKFSTIKKLSETFVDFLILLALGMDAKRNLVHYLDAANHKIDEFLGLQDWREQWLQASSRGGIELPKFLAETYAKQMETLDYLPVPFHRMKQVRSDVKNLPLYHLALFSRHTLAYELWEDVLKYSNSQSSFSY